MTVGRRRLMSLSACLRDQYLALFFLACSSTTCQIIWESLFVPVCWRYCHLHAQQACRYYGMWGEAAVSSWQLAVMVNRMQPRPESRQDQDDVFTTQQLARVHQLGIKAHKTSAKEATNLTPTPFHWRPMEKSWLVSVPTIHLLGTEIQQNLN